LKANEETLVFQRPAPTLFGILALSLFGFAVSAPILIGTGQLERLEEALPFLYGDGFPFGSTELTLFLAAITLPQASYLAMVVWVRHRYGRAEISQSTVIFKIPFAPIMPGRVEVPLSRIEAIGESRWGLIVTDAQQGRWKAYAMPLLVPVKGEEQVAQALRALATRPA
jgi:hypothetical protein